MRPPGFPGNPPARMPRAPTPARSPPPRPLRGGDVAFRPTHDVGPRDQCISGLNHAAYALPVNASRPGSPQAHASLGSGWWPTLAGWGWIPTGVRTRFRRSHHGILSPLTGLSRHTRWCTSCTVFARLGWCRQPLLSHNSAVNSKVHPKYKTQYRVGNWQASARTARRHHTLVLRPRDRRLEAGSVRPTGRAEKVLGGLHRDRPDAPTHLPLAVAPDGGFLAVDPRRAAGRS